MLTDEEAAFLRARLDDDEAALRTMMEVGGRQADQATDAEIARLTPLFMALMADPEMAALAARSAATGIPVPTDTNRLLAEVEVWRRILLEYAIPPGTDAVYGGTERETGFRLALSFALKAKIAAYGGAQADGTGPHPLAEG